MHFIAIVSIEWCARWVTISLWCKLQWFYNIKLLYDKLSNERLVISIYGYVLGFMLSLVIIFYNLRLKREKLNNTSLVCIVIATSFLTNYFYYKLTPKSDWMLNHINNAEQAKLWLQMYKTMSFYYHTGLVLGIVAVGILAFAFRC